MPDAMLKTELKDIPITKSGKVRDIFDLGDKLLIVASDRISAFDSVMPNGIPDKGKILTQISNFWFSFTSDLIANHIISEDVKDFPEQFQKYKDQLKKRTVLVKKSEVIPIECVVRGYLSGSGWKDYRLNGSVCGVKLPDDLKESDKLPHPIFTPTTKAESGHDLPITEKQMRDKVGGEITNILMSQSINIYQKAAAYALSRGVIIADTKFEFGEVGGNVILIDEVLTPDSSRFWPKDQYTPGKSQASFDKQFVRDYLVSIKWKKEPPAPALSEEVVLKTREKYLEAFKIITGKASL
ncbi:phosphoribosylaminoimidazolesuccinocarboxamide synthase [Candidatus Margulisiibacteriota bacterium]